MNTLESTRFLWFYMQNSFVIRIAWRRLSTSVRVRYSSGGRMPQTSNDERERRRRQRLFVDTQNTHRQKPRHGTAACEVVVRVCFSICIYASYISYADSATEPSTERVSIRQRMCIHSHGGGQAAMNGRGTRPPNSNVHVILKVYFERRSGFLRRIRISFVVRIVAVDVCARVSRSSSRHNKNRTMDAYIVQLDLFGRVATNSTALRQAARTLWPKKLNFFVVVVVRFNSIRFDDGK